MGKVVGMAFQLCGRIIPVKKVYCSKEVLAFRHPQPSYENHIILSPRKPIRNLQQLADARFCRYFMDIWEAAQQIRATHFAGNDSFVLIANGGKKQEVQQVHFHLFTNQPMIQADAAQALSGRVLASDGILRVVELPSADRYFHFALMRNPAHAEPDQTAYFKSILQSIDWLDAAFSIVEKGYSLVFQHSDEKCDRKYPVFHVLSGKRRLGE